MGRGGRKPSGGTPKTGNKHKWSGRNNGPSRQRYWSSGRLEARKVKALMKNTGMTRSAALVAWREARKGRMKTHEKK